MKGRRTKPKRPKQKLRFLAREKFCPYCQRLLNINNVSLDHLTPKVRFKGKVKDKGTGNLAAACKQCNKNKDCLMPLEFFMGCKKQVVMTRNSKGKLVIPQIKILPFKFEKQKHVSHRTVPPKQEKVIQAGLSPEASDSKLDSRAEE